MAETYAYCYRSGEIEFGPKVPTGALPLLSGDDATVREIVTAQARHAYDGKTLLVPGIPEANDDTEAGDAAMEFYRRLLGAHNRRHDA